MEKLEKLSLRPSTHVKGEEQLTAFTALIFGSHVRVVSYGESGKKATAVSFRLSNLDDPSHNLSKFPEDWSLGQPVRIIPNAEEITIGGVTYPPNTTFLDAKNPSNPDPTIFLGSGYSQKAGQMITAGVKEAELPERDVRGLDGLIFAWEVKEEPVYPGAKQTARRRVPVAYVGRADAKQLADAIEAFNKAAAAQPEQAGNTQTSGDAALVANMSGGPIAPPAAQAPVDSGAAKELFLAELKRLVAEKPFPTKDLTGLIVSMFKTDDAAKRALVTIFVNPIERKKALEAAGLKDSGTEVTV